VLDHFSKVCESQGDTDKATSFTKVAHHQTELVEKIAWNEDQFIRAFADDGRTIGFIDSIVQSWAVICGLINKDLAKKAITSVLNKLVDRENNVIKLLTPPIPFNNTPYLGYIQQYPQGVRENGGFYCHAAVWVVWALALEGDGDRANEIIDMINPFKRTISQEGVEKYMIEPYVLTSDINASGEYVGRGGWSWYTGSAATLYLVLMEEIFGLKLRKNTLIIDPCLPRSWDELTIRFNNYQIKISNPNKVSKGVKEVFLDGLKLPNSEIALSNDTNTHQVVVVMG
jgi:cellobiose phosphorylase